MAESENPTDGAEPGRAVRVDRHRIAREQAAAAAAAAASASAPAAPAPAPIAPAAPAARPKPAFRLLSAPPKDQTGAAVRRPALLSDRCVACGASTDKVSGMVTELVESGPVRALRVVACSECPDRRRRALTAL